MLHHATPIAGPGVLLDTLCADRRAEGCIGGIGVADELMGLKQEGGGDCMHALAPGGHHR